MKLVPYLFVPICFGLVSFLSSALGCLDILSPQGLVWTVQLWRSIRQLQHALSTDDPRKSQEGCNSVRMLAYSSPNPWRTNIARFGGLEVLVEAFKKYYRQDKEVGMECVQSIGASVAFNREASVRLNATGFHKDFFEHLRFYKMDRDVVARNYQAIAETSSSAVPENTAYIAQLGAFDIVFEALDFFVGEDYGEAQLACYIALSDHACTAAGAPIIANWRGRHAGLRVLAGKLRQAVAYSDATRFLTMRSAIMQDTNGVLRNDPTGEFGAALFSFGYFEDVVESMRMESDSRVTTDVACQNIERLLSLSNMYEAALLELGAYEAAANGVQKFADDYDGRLFGGIPMSKFFNAEQSCSTLLTRFVSPAALDRARRPENREKVLLAMKFMLGEHERLLRRALGVPGGPQVAAR